MSPPVCQLWRKPEPKTDLLCSQLRENGNLCLLRCSRASWCWRGVAAFLRKITKSWLWCLVDNSTTVKNSEDNKKGRFPHDFAPEPTCHVLGSNLVANCCRVLRLRRFLPFLTPFCPATESLP